MSEDEKILKILEEIRDKWRAEIKEERVELADTINLSYDDIDIGSPSKAIPDKENDVAPETVIISRDTLSSISSPDPESNDAQETAPKTVILPVAGKKDVSQPVQNERQEDLEEISTETVILSPKAIQASLKPLSETKPGKSPIDEKAASSRKEIDREGTESKNKKTGDDEFLEKTIILKTQKRKDRDDSEQ